MKLRLALFVILEIFHIIQGYKVLTVFPFCAHSHYSLGFRFAKELADRGHEVTFITCFPKNETIKNLREISVAETGVLLADFVAQLNDFGQRSYWGQLDFIHKMGLVYTDAVLRSKSVQELLNSNQQFDILLMEHFVNEAMTIFHHRFKCPFILFAAGPTTVLNNHLVGNSALPAFVPNHIADYGSRMTFWQRLQNLYRELLGRLFVNFQAVPEQNNLLKTIFPDAPDLSSILYNSSMLLILSHVSINEPVPLQPNIKQIGGYHVLEPKPLLSDIKKYLDEAKEGVVLFSMGSNLKSAHFEPEKRKAILNSFSKIKQKVLWKFEADLLEKPGNVMVKKWLPQQDIMAHPNVVAFISHGGLLGTIEAIYHGLPIIGLPVYWDQTKNIEDCARNGFAIRLNYMDLNEETFSHALNEILNNPKYRRIAKERSRIMHDQPVKQIDEAIFWVEYVARHKGAPYLKSPALNLNWYQRYLLDILLFLSLIVFMAFFVVIKILRLIFSMEISKKNKQN